MEIEEGVIRRGVRPKRITPSEISIILHMIRKSNSKIVILFIQKFEIVRFEMPWNFLTVVLGRLAPES